MHFNLAFLLASAAIVAGSPVANRAGHVVHEKRDMTPRGWYKRGTLNGKAVFPLRFGLRQRNMHQGEEFLDSVSNPRSSKYAQHWSPKEVADMFAPSDETISAVKNWLVDFGFAPERLSLSSAKSWISVDATVDEAEALLDTKYYTYQHESGHPHIACDSYSIPGHLSEHHIDLVMPTVHFDAHVKRGEKRDNHRFQPGRGGPRRGRKPIDRNGLITELENCDMMITPDCLRALYSFSTNQRAVEGNSYGIVEYTPVAFLPADLDMFFSVFSKDQVGNRPIFDSIDGGVSQTIAQGFDFNGEADLDLEYSMALVFPQNITLFQTGDLVEGASFNNLLDALDASYCTFEGGDNPEFDGIYPDTLPGGFDQPETCGAFTPPNVISTSFSMNEFEVTPFYAMRQCNEYMKLGLMGTTVLYSSGDDGVASNGNQCLGPDGRAQNGTLGGSFAPSFPGVCPFVTSVGATQVPNNTNIVRELASGVQPEIACATVIFSGGGFSNIFPRPSYQEEAVSHFLERFPPQFPAGTFNTSNSRGFPDVSANGAFYVIAVDGEFEPVFGTSCSSPVFGSIVTLINQELLAEGKKPVGFINPALYANPEVMNDITKGNNPGCNTEGFTAEVGWDPVTGLGTPNFPKMLDLFRSLQDERHH